MIKCVMTYILNISNRFFNDIFQYYLFVIRFTDYIIYIYINMILYIKISQKSLIWNEINVKKKKFERKWLKELSFIKFLYEEMYIILSNTKKNTIQHIYIYFLEIHL